MSSGPGGSGTGGSAPSQKHSIQCKYCDEKPLVKNYPAHLSRKHPNEDQNDRTGKGGQSLLTFFPKRSRSSDDAVSKNKKKNCSGSGDSAIELEDRELEEDFGSTNLAPVSDEDADDVQQQSSSKAGGAGLPGQVGKLPQDFGSTSLAPVNVSDEDADDVQQQPADSGPPLQKPLLEEVKEIVQRSENKINLLLNGNFKDTIRDGDTVKVESGSLDVDVSRRITDARSMKALEDEGFTYNTGLVICNICKESFKYDEDERTDFTKVGDILPTKFRSLKRNVKIHLTRKVHTDAVNQIKTRDEETTKVFSRNERAGMIVFRQAYSHIKMRRPDRDFEKELFLLSKAGCDIGNINHSANLIGKFRPFLHKTIKQQISNFFSSPMIVTGFTPALAYTGMFACYNFFLGQ